MIVGDRITNPNFIEAVRRIYPGVSFVRDVVMQDNRDGLGPFLAQWNLAGPIPTDIDITNAIAGPRPDADVTGPINQAMMKVLFNHENRIRALEGKAAITAAQFITAIKVLL
jgi:XkdW protein